MKLFLLFLTLSWLKGSLNDMISCHNLGQNTSTVQSKGESNGVDKTLRNAVEFMGLDGDKETIQASVEAMKPATPAKGK